MLTLDQFREVVSKVGTMKSMNSSTTAIIYPFALSDVDGDSSGIWVDGIEENINNADLS